jgi:hypothetical protein
MSGDDAFDESLARRLPLPLAKLYRRAHNARDPFDRHQAAYFLWEAALKLLGSAAIVAYAEHRSPDPKLAERLTNLARPALGHWWEFVRELVPVLAAAGDQGFAPVKDVLFGRAPDLKQSATLNSTLRQELDGDAAGQGKWRVADLFERLVRYRNREIGHGAVGQRPREYYERLGGPLLAGITELLGRLDVLGGRRLVYFAEIRQLKFGNFQIERDELMGEIPKRLEPLTWPRSDRALPYPDCLYLAAPAADTDLRSLRPLLVYDPNSGEVFFLNAQRGAERLEYLCYTSACMVNREELLGEQRELMARILGMPVDPNLAGQWAHRAKAEEENQLTENPVELADTGKSIEPAAVTAPEGSPRVAPPMPASTDKASVPTARKPIALIAAGITGGIAIAIAIIAWAPWKDRSPTLVDRGTSSSSDNGSDKPSGTDSSSGDHQSGPQPDPPLRSSLREMSKQVAKLLKNRSEDTIAVGAFTGPAHCPSSAGPGIKAALIEELEKLNIHVKPQAKLEIKGDYREVVDKGSELMVLRVKAEVLDRDGESLAKLDQKIEDREVLAQVLGITRPDPGQGVAPKQESAELVRCLTKPSAEVDQSRVKANADGKYAIEIEVKKDDSFVPATVTVEDGFAYVTLKKSDVFAINLINDSDHDAAVELTLDGLAMFAFSASHGYRYVIVPKHGSLLVKGWHRTNDVSDSFVITDYSKSAVAELLANPDNIGTITAMFSAAWDAKGKPPVDEGVKFRDPFNPAVGRGEPVTTPFKEIALQRGRVRDIISVRYKKPA